MLSRASGSLRPRVSHALPITRRAWDASKTRTYADPTAHRRRKDNDSGAAFREKIFQRIRSERESKEQATGGRKPSAEVKAQPSNRATQGSSPQQDVVLTKRMRKELVKLRDLESDTRCGIITTSQPHKTTIEELLRGLKFEPLKHAFRRWDGGEDRATLILLLTPGLARHALDPSVPAAVAESLQLGSFPGKLRSITAVVDRLPTSDDQPEGSEGMAYMLLQNPSPFSPETQTPMQESAQRPGSLNFVIARRSTNQSGAIIHTLQLPLSQTVFSTGLVSTMFERYYNYQDKETRSEWVFNGERKLESQTLHLPALDSHGTTHTYFSPLVPLTPFRKIQYAMGNIVRKLSPQPRWSNENRKLSEPPEDPDQSMPASQELEEAVSKYFETLKLNPAPVSVWAFVIPREADMTRAKPGTGGPSKGLLLYDEEKIVSTWKAQSSSQGTYFPTAWLMLLHGVLPLGGRLIKVLSGGGGWGKKAGLLSLDPDTEYSTRELRQDDGWKFNFDRFDDGTSASSEEQKKQALGEIVKEGDSVMFFLAPGLENLEERLEEANKQKLARRLAEREGLEGKPQFALSFGALPSSIDEIPQNNESASAPARFKHYPGYFGMLSEGGMALNYKRPGVAHSKEVQTKFDVPFSRMDFKSLEGQYWPALRFKKQLDTSNTSAKEVYKTNAPNETQVRPEESSEDSAVALEYNPEAADSYFEQISADDQSAESHSTTGKESK